MTHLGGGEVLEAQLEQQQQQPAREQRAQPILVEGWREEHEVGHALHRLARHALLHGGAEPAEEDLGLRTPCHLHDTDALGGEEERVEAVEGQLPPQAGRELVLGEVERQLVAERPVEL